MPIKFKDLIDLKKFFGKCTEDNNFSRIKSEKLIYQINDQNEVILKFQENVV